MNFKSLYTKALKFSEQGDYLKAVMVFDKYIFHNPNSADAISDRGVAKFHLKDLHGSLEDLNQAVQLEPENPYRYSSRAFIKDCSGDTKGAINDYKKSIFLDPDNAVSQNNLGLLEEKLGYKEIAKKRYVLADELSEKREIKVDEETLKKRDEVVNKLLNDLNILVDGIPKPDKSILSHMLSVLTSTKERKDFVNYLLKLLRMK